jgi:hypothetical protein
LKQLTVKAFASIIKRHSKETLFPGLPEYHEGVGIVDGATPRMGIGFDYEAIVNELNNYFKPRHKHKKKKQIKPHRIYLKQVHPSTGRTIKPKWMGG